MQVSLLSDPREFASVCAAWLAADPCGTSAISIPLDGVLRGLRPQGSDTRWVVAAQGAQVLGGALYASPVQLFLPRLPAGVAAQIAGRLLDTRRPVLGVHGERLAAREFARAWSARSGGTSRLTMALRLYRLSRLRVGPSVSGAARIADGEEREVVTRWLREFHAEATPDQRHEPVDDAAERRLRARQLWLWWDGGEPVSLAGRSALVSLAGHGAPSTGLARIGPVYTPPEHRRHGYGAAVTAAATGAALDDGASAVVLYADLANPTSNSIYPAIGYVRDHDAEERRLLPAAPGAEDPGLAELRPR
ncbi:MAG TPA: GNAT family N-acetyltransferase [Candidatus Binatia bacterium]|nr:GNAT family N-acetyltransferase [Candidatus Binatia bacterium]